MYEFLSFKSPWRKSIGLIKVITILIIYIYIYIYRERERERERQTDRQTDRDKERNQGKEGFCDIFKVKKVLEVRLKVTFFS